MRQIIFMCFLWAGCTGEASIAGVDVSIGPSEPDGGAGDLGRPLPDQGLVSDTGLQPGPDVRVDDVGPDLPPEEPDVGPPDYGNPVFLNPCESGPLEFPIADCRPVPLPSTGDEREDCVRRINQFRWECQCLPPLTRWHEGEACADQQAAFDAETSIPHNGFSSGVCSPRGFAQNECPGWGSWGNVISGCLQQMWDEGPGEPFSAHGHYINMSSSRYSTVACGVGDGWYVQNFQ